jgi:hypothetical protein
MPRRLPWSGSERGPDCRVTIETDDDGALRPACVSPPAAFTGRRTPSIRLTRADATASRELSGGGPRMRDGFSWALERAKGIEPSYEAWEASVLPLNYARISKT